MRRFLSSWLITAFAILFVGATISSCGKDDDDEPATLSINPTSVSLISTAGSSANVEVKCSGVWSVTNYPEWINLSASSGNGNTSITLTALTENNTASARTGIISFVSGDLTAQLSVSQVAGLQSGLEVNITDEVILVNSATFKLSFGPKVDYILSGYFNASSAGWSDDKILEALQNADPMSADTETITASSLDSGTSYVQCFVGYDSKGNHGEIIRRTFETPYYSNLDNAPYADIENVRYNSTTWYWTTNINAAADVYYQIYQSGDLALLMAMYLAPSDFAMLIKESVNSLTAYKNGWDGWSTARGAEDNDLVISTWAQRDSKWSGVINIFWGHLSANDIQKKSINKVVARQLRDGEVGKNNKITKSDWQKYIFGSKIAIK
ncbi:MAG: BACON domain-containing protein [Muribaculaceae bacterium]|nr:BACON domain-containing protein [Muribaculaceae bacterium]